MNMLCNHKPLSDMSILEQYLGQLCRDRVSGRRMNTTNPNNLAENALH
jgi:hypothetical protein